MRDPITISENKMLQKNVLFSLFHIFLALWKKLQQIVANNATMRQGFESKYFRFLQVIIVHQQLRPSRIRVVSMGLFDFIKREMKMFQFLKVPRSLRFGTMEEV